METPAKKRIDTLDAFRGIAAVSVLLVHYTFGYRAHYGQSFNAAYDFRYGYMGVEFFFMISGFVIYLTLLNSKNTQAFLYKRFTRIYPTFLFCLALTFTIVLIFGLPMRQRSLYQAVGNIFIATNVFGFKPVDGVYWTLEIEIFFYLSIALLLFFNKLKYILVWGTLFLSLTWLNHFTHVIPAKLAIVLNVYYNCLFFAGILFYFIKFRKARVAWHIHVLIIATYATALLVLPLMQERIIVTIFYLAFYLFSYDLLKLHAKPLLFLGKISYPLYLLHQNIGYVIMNLEKPFLGNYPFLFIGSTTIIILFISWMVHIFIEQPSITFCRNLYLKKFSLNMIGKR